MWYEYIRSSYKTATIQIDQLYVWVQCTEAHKDQQRNIKTQEVELLEMNEKKARLKQHQQQYCNGNDTRLFLNKELWVFSVLRLRYVYALNKITKKKNQCINSRTSDRNIWMGRVVELKILIKIYIRQSSAYSVCGALLYSLSYLTYRNCYLIFDFVSFFVANVHTQCESNRWFGKFKFESF